MNALTLMRFLTRKRIGFKVAGIDRVYAGPPRCTRWWKIWPATSWAPNARAIVDFQHHTTLSRPYWQARIRIGRYGFDFSTGPR